MRLSPPRFGAILEQLDRIHEQLRGIPEPWQPRLAAGIERARNELSALEFAGDKADSAGGLLQMAMQIAHAGAWQWDPTTNKVVWSDENFRLFGLEPGSATPSYDLWLQCVHPDDRAAADAEVVETLDRRSDLDITYRIIRPDGQVRWINDIGKLTFDAEGNPAMMTGFQIDITRRRELEARLADAARYEAVGRLAGGIAHDFNNLLAVIAMSLGMLPDENTSAHIQRARTAVDQGANLTRQLLYFSRTAATRRETLHLSDVTAASIEVLDCIIGENIALNTAFGPDNPLIEADRSQIEQVVMNLVINARDAMPDGGTLAVRTSCANIAGERAVKLALDPGPYAVLEVSDCGSGIAATALASVFDPFYTTKAEGKGTGLGLATVKSILDVHGGGIEVESTPSEGSVFRVLLPSADSSAKCESEPAPPRPEKELSIQSLLVVDNDDTIRALLREMLSDIGFAVLAARSADEAVAMWASADPRPDAVITDVALPGDSGFVLAQQLRMRRPDLPILLISGYVPEADASFDDTLAFLAKPFESAALVASLREACHRCLVR